MSAEQFIELLEQREILPDRLLVKLRAKVGESDRPMTANTLAKFLVQKKHLSSQQASELLDEMTSSNDENTAEKTIGNRPAGALEPDDALDTEEPGSSSIFFSPPSQSGNDHSLESADDLDGDEFSLAPVEEDHSDVDVLPVAELIPQRVASFDGPEALDEKSAATSPSSRRGPPTGRDTKERRRDDRSSQGRTSKPPNPESRRKVKPKGKNEWESPLLLVGGGVLLLLVLCGVAVLWILRAESGDDQLQLARSALADGSYTQAISHYERFLKDFSGHVEWSSARVQLATARLRQATESGSNYELALDVAREELRSIESEPRFSDSHAELAALLPRIARGLSDKAEQSADKPDETARLTQAATEALGLCLNTKYVPRSLRDDTELDLVEETLARVARRQESRRDLDEALRAMSGAIEEGDTRSAYATHKSLVEQHPELVGDEQLLAAVVATSAAEQAGVKFVSEEQPAETAERPTPWVVALATGNRRGGPKSTTGGTYCARIDGALYAVDVSTGRLLWRRYVGFASSAPPVPLGDHLLVVDSKKHELLRLDARSGRLVWRQAFDGPIAAPLAVAGKAFLASEAGRLFIVDLSSGARSGYLQFAQPLRVSPAVDRSGERLFLAGDHSSLYTISLKDLSCLGVYFLGHASGSVRVPPVQVLDKLAVLENDGAASCLLRLLSLNQQGAVSELVIERRLKGLAASPPLVAGRRLIVVTDRGALDAFDVGAGTGDNALTQVATREATSQRSLIRHVAMTEGAIWVGDNQLTKYAVLPTGNRLPVQTIGDNFAGATFDHPFGMFGKTLVHVRRPADRAGVVVAATDTEDGRSLWATDLAVPAVASPTISTATRTIAVANVDGFVFRFDEQAIRSRVQDQPLQGNPASLRAPKLTVGVDLGGGRAAFAAPTVSELLLLYDPAQSSQAANWIRLPSPLACAPSRFDQGLLTPLEVGQVFYLDSASGEPLAAPFQPRLQPRTSLRYVPAGDLEGPARQFVISDGHEKIYLVGLVDHPQPHLQAITEANVGPFPIVSPIVILNDTAFAVIQGGQLARFALPSLQRTGETDLPAAVVWGPYRMGELLLVATADEQLLAVVPDGDIAWALPLDGELAGPPLEKGGNVLLAYRSGILERRRLADGQPSGRRDVEHPLATGPVLYQQRVLLTAHDGTLLVVDEP